MTHFTPSSSDEVLSAVQWALSEEEPLEIVGHGSKRGIGRPVQAAHTLDLSALSGVTLYEPEELILSAKAGTPLGEIEKLLDENRQQLAFEPMDYGRLFGAEPGRGTIGGATPSFRFGSSVGYHGRRRWRRGFASAGRAQSCRSRSSATSGGRA